MKPNWRVIIDTYKDDSLTHLDTGKYDIYADGPVIALAMAIERHYAKYGYKTIYGIELENLL